MELAVPQGGALGRGNMPSDRPRMPVIPQLPDLPPPAAPEPGAPVAP